MKPKQEANQYDKIFKENLESVTMALVEKVLRIQVAHYEKMPLELQRTLERKPDQLLKVTDKEGHTFLLQLEFQLVDETAMVERMLEYRGILRRKFDLEVRQYVLFLSDSVPTMPTRIEEDNLVFAFHLVQLSQVDYRLFLSSDKADEVVFAVLGHFGAIEPEKAAEQIITKLQQTSASKTELNRHLADAMLVAASNS